MRVMFAVFKLALRHVCRDVAKNQTVQAAAALSYYSILSIFPALILLSAVMANIPLSDFFADLLVAMGRVLPPGIMPMIDSVMSDSTHLGAWLSLGTLGTLWVVSSTFDEMIEALDAAYDSVESRSFLRTRLLALGLATITAFFIMCAIAVLIIGPRVGAWIAERMSLSAVFLFLWPILHRSIAIAFAVFAAAIVYFLAPNVKHRFRANLPGAIFSVLGWMGLSFLLGLYFRYFANYNKIYGTLGGVMALMTWLYWAFFIFLAGGELNAELAKAGRAEASRAAEGRSGNTSRDRAA
jgi:membrane protein